MHVTAGNVQAQGTAMFRQPPVVQIPYARQPPRVVVAKLVAVASIRGSRRIQSVMALEGKKTKIQRLVERRAKCLDRLPQRHFGARRGTLIQPQNAIASYVGALAAACATVDTRSAKFAGRIAPSRFQRERCDDWRWQKIVNDCVPVIGDTIAESSEHESVQRCCAHFMGVLRLIFVALRGFT